MSTNLIDFARHAAGRARHEPAEESDEPDEQARRTCTTCRFWGAGGKRVERPAILDAFGDDEITGGVRAGYELEQEAALAQRRCLYAEVRFPEYVAAATELRKVGPDWATALLEDHLIRPFTHPSGNEGCRTWELKTE